VPKFVQDVQQGSNSRSLKRDASYLAQLNGEPLEATLLRSPLIACTSCPCRNVAGGRWLAAAAQTMGATLRPAPEQTPVLQPSPPAYDVFCNTGC
jgi:hypothetical protein